jgi:hypothetical protein
VGIRVFARNDAAVSSTMRKKIVFAHILLLDLGSVQIKKIVAYILDRICKRFSS